MLESEKKYRNLVENINNVIFSLNPAGIVTYISPTIERITGYAAPELTGKNLLEIVYPEDCPKVEKRIRESFRSEYIEPSEYRIIHKSGNIRWVTSSSRQILQDGNAVGIQGVLTDITHTRIMEAKLREARKMETVGTLAGGIAHEINNLLSVILGRVELTLLDLPEWSPNRKSLKEILNASIKAREVVRQLLCFARKSLPNLKPIDINAIVEKSVKTILASVPEKVEIRLDLPSEPQTIMGDPAEITQILANLYSNAVHAMKKKGGIMDVSVSPIRIHSESPEKQKEMGSGDFVKLTVEDSGEGMAPHVMERIFDPYFTTREVGEGTGMGMAVVYGFVKKCNGEIHVKSEIDKGTVVELLFPKYQDTGPSSS